MASPSNWIIPEELFAEPGDSSPESTRRVWNNCLVIVKVLSQASSQATFLKSVQTWTNPSFSHKNVLKVFGSSSPDSDPLFLVGPAQKNGNISTFLASNPAADKLALIQDVASGMQYLHANSVIHGSLKPTNMLIDLNGHALISDYGVVAISPNDVVAAHRYFSPEAWKGTTSRPSDVYAYAMSIFEIYTSTPPWGVLSDNQLYQLVVRENERPDRPEPDQDDEEVISNELWELLEECWHKESRLRPRFDHIIHRLQNPGSRVPKPITTEPLRQRTLPLPPTPTSSIPPPSSRNSSNVSTSPPRTNDLRSEKSQHRWNNPDAEEQISPAPPAYEFAAERNARNPVSQRTVDSTNYDMPPIPANVDELVGQYAVLTVNNGPSTLQHSPNPSARGTNYFAGTGVTSLPTTPMSVASMPNNARPHISQQYSSSIYSEGGRGRNGGNIGSISEGEAQTFEGGQSRQLQPAPRRQLTLRPSSTLIVGDATRAWQERQRLANSSGLSDINSIMSDSRSKWSDSSPSNAGSGSGGPSAVTLANALRSELPEDDQNREVINEHLLNIHKMAARSDKASQRLVTAGTVPSLISLLKTRAQDAKALELVLITLGLLAHDSISANTISRTHTVGTLINIFNAGYTTDVTALSVWCLNRICRNAEVAAALVKSGLPALLIHKGFRGAQITARLSAWCLGTMVYNDALADTLSMQGLVMASVDNLRNCAGSLHAQPDDICAAVYCVARMARSIKLSKALAKEGCIEFLVHYLKTSEHPQVLYWSARAIGCLMRPNSSDMSKALLAAGSAEALARLPSVLAIEEVEPLASFAFAIQRFSCAEWGGGTRKALVEAGVVDSLLAALRTAADLPFPTVHKELALAVSFLGDVGGSSIRKEIVSAGGIDILKRVGAAATQPEVEKACTLAVTSITGNIFSRNAASAKTAMGHDWSGGCPEHQPACPLNLVDDDDDDNELEA